MTPVAAVVVKNSKNAVDSVSKAYRKGQYLLSSLTLVTVIPMMLALCNAGVKPCIQLCLMWSGVDC